MYRVGKADELHEAVGLVQQRRVARSVAFGLPIQGLQGDFLVMAGACALEQGQDVMNFHWI